MTDPCEFLSDDNGQPGAFLRHTGPINGPRFHMTAASSEGISVDGRGSEDAVRTVTYRVLLGSTVVTKGHFWIRVDRYPGYDIYEGTDEFVNTCIDDTYKLHSRDHRLYCYVPGGVIRDYYFTKRPKMPNGPGRCSRRRRRVGEQPERLDHPAAERLHLSIECGGGQELLRVAEVEQPPGPAQVEVLEVLLAAGRQPIEVAVGRRGVVPGGPEGRAGEEWSSPGFVDTLIAGPSGPAARIDVHAVNPAVFA